MESFCLRSCLRHHRRHHHHLRLRGVVKLKMGILSVRGGKMCRWRRERLIIGEKRR
jgi:hypothetical protein